jgi:hypothetical protein
LIDQETGEKLNVLGSSIPVNYIDINKNSEDFGRPSLLMKKNGAQQVDERLSTNSTVATHRSFINCTKSRFSAIEMIGGRASLSINQAY